MRWDGRILANALHLPLPDQSVHMVVTSPPYWGLRRYKVPDVILGGLPNCDHVWEPVVARADERSRVLVGKSRTTNRFYGRPSRKFNGNHQKHADGSICASCGAYLGQLGLEPSPAMYVEHLVEIFDEIGRVLRDDGTVWLNLGDCYTDSGRGSDTYSGLQGTRYNQAESRKVRVRESRETGLREKNLVGVPWRAVLALQDAGWYWRSAIVWHKKNCLSAGTLLYSRTQKGDMPATIHDLVRLDPRTVKLWNGHKWTQVLSWTENRDPERPLAVVLRSGERLSCTPDHVWPTNRGNIRADELRLGDIIQSVQLPEPQGTDPSYLTTEAAWFIGLYLAEGSHAGETIQIAGHADELDRVDRLRTLAGHYGGSVAYTIDGNKLSIRLYGRMLNAILDSYIGGSDASDKHLKTSAWRLSNALLRAITDGYLDGDGHHDARNCRYRLGFTRNYHLADDLRTLAARLNATLTLKPTYSKCLGKLFRSFRGEWRWTRSGDHNEKDRGEIVAIKFSRARRFYDIAVADEPHLFALASGRLTHNCMPGSQTDRPTSSWEPVFLLSKAKRYYYDYVAIMEPVTGHSHPRGNGTSPKMVEERGQHRNNRSFGTSVTDVVFARNRRDVWSINSEQLSENHYAAFPERLVEPCILAGTSEHGCCAQCQAPWRRQIKKQQPSGTAEEYTGKHVETDPRSASRRILKNNADTRAAGADHDHFLPPRTIGWKKSCCCETDERVPAIVLDPFCGSGTTARVAERLNRRWIAVDLGYQDMQERRVKNVQKELIHV